TAKLVLDRVVDRVVVANLEMQERVLLDAAPVAAEQDIGADEVDGARNPAIVALGHDQQDAVAHLLADDRIERAVEIRPAPFARAGLHVELEESVPDAFGQLRAGQPMHRDAVLECIGALASDHLAFARGEGGEEILEAAVARVLPMKLAMGALEI